MNAAQYLSLYSVVKMILILGFQPNLQILQKESAGKQDIFVKAVGYRCTSVTAIQLNIREIIMKSDVDNIYKDSFNIQKFI